MPTLAPRAPASEAAGDCDQTMGAARKTADFTRKPKSLPAAAAPSTTNKDGPGRDRRPHKDPTTPTTEIRAKRRSPIPREWTLGETYDVELEELAKRLDRAIQQRSYGSAAMYQDMINARLGKLSDKELSTFWGTSGNTEYSGANSGD